MNLKTFVQGFGAAMVLMIARLAPLISPYHAVIYHSILPMRSVVWGVLIDLAVLSALMTLVIAYLKKDETALRNLVWAFIAATLANRVAATIITTLGWNVPGLTPMRTFALVLAGSLALLWLRPTYYRTAVHGLLVALLLAGVNALWMVPELLYQGMRTEPVEARVPIKNAVAVSARAPSSQRIVWLLFDELSYDQTFEHRFPGLAMPFFDQLKKRSVVFTDLKPIGYSTELVIPSLLTGRPVNKVRSDLDGSPSIHFTGSDQWQPFDPQATVFADARRLNWTTGIVGWFNPYCRMLAGTLDSCFWRMGDGEFAGPLSTKSVFENAVAPLQNLTWILEGKPRFSQRSHSADLAAIMTEAKALILDDDIRFVFIHLPVPHLPGLYDRRTQTLQPTSTYIDNLALSDRVLGELMATLNATPSAANTTVIVCSDHSWRVPLWRANAMWRPEEEQASHGRLDPRPVLMIQRPGQQTEQDITTPFEEIRLHDTIEHLLRGEDPTF
jgi:Sulfatase